MRRRLYDTISRGYVEARRPDPRVAAQIDAALSDAHTVVNIGAGTGNYEPTDRAVVAVEPADGMLVRRADGAAPAVQAVAEHLPFGDGSFDAAMATLTLHHWTDLDAGLREMARVARRQVVLYFDPSVIAGFWAIEYFPEAMRLDSETAAPDADRIARVLPIADLQPVPIPIDCTDGFGAAYWGRPEAYLDEGVQAGMSWLAQLPAAHRAEGSARLAADLRSGAWDERHGHLRALTELDVGYRLLAAGRG